MDFDALPPSARTWIFTADRAVPPDAAARLLGSLEHFLSAWTSHGRPVPSAAAVLHDRFLVVAAHVEDGTNAGVSGCGIDAMTHAAREAAAAAGITWADALDVLYRAPDGMVRSVSRPAFRRLARAGEIDTATPVFDTTHETLGALRRYGIERPAANSWHGRAFRLASRDEALT